MKNKVSYLDYEDKKLPICFNLNVMEEIQEVYGSMSNWGKIVEGDGEPKIKDLKVGLLAMINEAIDMENENNDEKIAPLNLKQIGRIIGEIGFDKIIKTIKELTVSSTKVEDDGKNE